MSDNEEGWQPDPTGKHDHRYWDGTEWTDNVADAGVAGTDPYEAPAPAPTPEPEVPAAEEPTAIQSVASADPTETLPTTPPAAPPPYVPPSPTSDGGDGDGDGGSKRGLLVGGGILAAVAIAVVAFLLLGGDDESDVRARMASAIDNDEDINVTADQAECMADVVVDEAGEDAFEDTDFEAEEPPEEFTAAVESVGVENILEECDVDEETAFGDGSTDGSTDDSSDGGEGDLEGLRDDCSQGDFRACDDLYFSADSGSELEEFGSTCGGIAPPQGGYCEETDGGETAGGATDGLTDMPDEDAWVALYAQLLGVSVEQAECLAAEALEAYENGELTEEQMTSQIFDFYEDCDIPMDEVEED